MNFLSRYTSLPVGHLEEVEKLEQLRALENGFRIMVVQSPVDSVEVDVEADIIKVESMLKTQQSSG